MARLEKISAVINSSSLATTLTVLCTISLIIGFFGSLFGVISEQTSTYFYIAAYLTGGYSGTIQSVKALVKFKINVDVLMILAAIGAAIIGNWLEGAVLLFLFSLSNTLQEYAMGRSRKAIQALMKLRPDQALVKCEDGTEEYRPIENLEIGDAIIVKPGERIPIDGVVEKGVSSVNQSAITGESLPVSKESGNEVFAATMNEEGILTIKVTRLAEDTTLAKIIRLVEEAQSKKAETQRFLDEFESRYAIGVILFTVGLILVPYYLLNEAFAPVFYRAMTVLVVASPCALIISTPATILSAIANAAKNGVLFKGGAYLEQAADITSIAFDKTGTLTKGKAVVTKIITFNNGVENQSITEEEVLSLAAAAEEHSEHHLAHAIWREAEKRGQDSMKADKVDIKIGMGVAAQVGQNFVEVGNRKLFEQNPDELESSVREKLYQVEKENRTVIYVRRNQQLIGLILFDDQVREEAPTALGELREMGVQKFTILTGDRKSVVQDVAKNLNIDRYYGELLPEQKVEIIRELAQTESIAMVGDGVNDAPALASSQLGIAMGAIGTDVALETADVVLMSDDLTKIPYLIRLSRHARKVVWQNIIFSLSVIVFLVLSVFLFAIPLPLGVIGHEGSTLIVVLNGLRLLRSN